jgi:hypothetical protein
MSIVSSTIVLPQYTNLLSTFNGFDSSVGNFWFILFHVTSQLFMMALLIKTYNSYFSFKYHKSYEDRIGVYILEFYIFILTYICLIIAAQFMIMLL